ncbi:VOC family protein [Mucilaginibacter flavus]|nr:VOC family protein [Mucilaginibacter flavus]
MHPAYPQIKKMSPLFVVADLEQSLNFYRQNLGFEIDFRYEDFYAGIIKDGFSIHLKLGYSAIKNRVSNSDDEHIDLTFEITGINDFFEVIKTLPVTIIQPLRQMPYGTEFYIADPDGYTLAFLE